MFISLINKIIESTMSGYKYMLVLSQLTPAWE